MPLRGSMQVMITVHPSHLLRVPDALRDEAYARFVQDLRAARPFAGDARHR